MAKENSGGQKQVQKPAPPTPPVAAYDSVPKAAGSKKRKNARNTRPQIGGTAVQGAKSTLPRQLPEGNNQQQQQYESYNRTMRRRMDAMGTAPDEEGKAQKLQNQRKKRLERRREQLETRRAELRRQMPNFGRRNLYFFLGAVAIIVLLIVIFVVLRALHILS